MLKRSFDVAVSAIALVVLVPVLLVIGLIIRLDSPGPAIFRQERVGRDGRPFRIHKFRTMRWAEQPEPRVTAAADRRVTRFGGFLRRTKLDELPQLIDVVQGAMSLVGPRPEVLFYVDRWSPAAREIILSMRPGITDPASILLRHEERELATADDAEAYYLDVLLPRKTAVYIDYVASRNFGGDLRIIARTLRVLLS